MKILVTGGTNGKGKGVAKVLAGIDDQIHEVILLCRSKELGEATIKEFENVTKGSPEIYQGSDRIRKINNFN